MRSFPEKFWTEVLQFCLTRTHGADVSDPEFGQLYKRMMITLSLTHSISVVFWADSSVVSDPVRRYEIYKKLHDSDLLLNSVFEHLNVEECAGYSMISWMTIR